MKTSAVQNMLLSAKVATQDLMNKQVMLMEQVVKTAKQFQLKTAGRWQFPTAGKWLMRYADKLQFVNVELFPGNSATKSPDTTANRFV